MESLITSMSQLLFGAQNQIVNPSDSFHIEHFASGGPNESLLSASSSILETQSMATAGGDGTLNTSLMQTELERKLKRLKKITETVERD